MQNKQISTVFLGTPDFAVPSLAALVRAGYKPVVITAPDKAVGRQQVLTPSPVKLVAQEEGLEIYTPEKLDDDFFELFRKLNIDLAIVVAYGKIIPEKYLSLPRFGFINVHPSLLPKYRGPSPIQSAILNGDRQTGMSIMILDKEIDHGPVLSNTPYEIPENAYLAKIAHELALLGSELLIKTISSYIAGNLAPKEQDHSQATFTKKITRQDGKINWLKPATEIFNQVRALSTEPGVWTTWQGKTLKIISVEPSHKFSENPLPGAVLLISTNQIAVQTKTDLLILLRLQLEGANEMDAAQFIPGHPNFIGSTLE